jgi:hypothetical protein
MWLVIALPYTMIVTWPVLRSIDPAQDVANARFLVEQAATLFTGAFAAFAAFHSAIPGFNRRIVLLPLAPLVLWLASVGHGCAQDWIRLGSDGVAVRPDWDCLPMATIIGIVPAAAIVVMLRRALPLHPRLTLFLAALAVASIANFALQFAHTRDASIIVLTWHLGAAAALTAAGGLLGDRVLRWQPDRSLLG